MAVIIHYEIPSELHRMAKASAAAQGITLKALIVNALLVAVGEEAYTPDRGRRPADHRPVR